MASNEVAFFLKPLSRRVFEIRCVWTLLSSSGAATNRKSSTSCNNWPVRLVFHEQAGLQQGTTITKTRHKLMISLSGATRWTRRSTTPTEARLTEEHRECYTPFHGHCARLASVSLHLSRGSKHKSPSISLPQRDS